MDRDREAAMETAWDNYNTASPLAGPSDDFAAGWQAALAYVRGEREREQDPPRASPPPPRCRWCEQGWPVLWNGRHSVPAPMDEVPCEAFPTPSKGRS